MIYFGNPLIIVLLSSYRDFETENDWEWLRNDSSHGDLLKFEKTIEEGKFEMVVSKDWSSKVSLSFLFLHHLPR